MSSVNKKLELKGFRKKSHLNWMQGLSYDISDPIFKLRLSASSCFFGEPMYYQKDEKDTRKVKVTSEPKLSSQLSSQLVKGLAETLNAISPLEWRDFTPAKLMEKVIDEAVDSNPEGTLKEAVRLREKEHIRVTPQIIMVRFANHPKIKGLGKESKLLKDYAPKIMKRGDEPSIQMAYQLSAFGKPIPNALKKAWRMYLQKASKYDLAKYRMESREVKTVDVINVVHPKSENVSLLSKGELKLDDETETWESLISREGSTKESWIKAIGIMNHMALLRNLRNFIQHEIDPSMYMNKLLEGVEKGQQLPFRYYSAYLAILDTAPPQLLDQLEKCLIKSFENSPKFEGKVISLCDNSGSAQHTATSAMGTLKISDIANLTAVFTGHLADEGYIGVFGDSLKIMPIRKNASVFDQVKKANEIGTEIGQSTENGIWIFFDNAIKNKEHYDSIFIYSDMQAGHGGLYGLNPKEYTDFIWGAESYPEKYIDVPKLIAKYRTEVNPNVKVYCVQVAGYQDTIVPEFYQNTFILGGWGDGIFRFAKEMESLSVKQ